MVTPNTPAEKADHHIAVLTGPNSPEKSDLIAAWMKFGEPQDRDITTAMIVRRLAERIEQHNGGVLSEIAKERDYQSKKWGNDFDDANSEQDWAAFIMHYTAVGITTRLGAAPGRPFREAMLKVATLAIAAIEAHDRNDDLTRDINKRAVEDKLEF